MSPYRIFTTKESGECSHLVSGVATNLSGIFAKFVTPEEFENATITGHFGFVFEKNSVRDIT